MGWSFSFAGSLKVALSEIGRRQENQVLAFNEMFSIGPITHLEKEEGQQNRLQWLTDRFACYTHQYFHNRENQIANMMETISKIPESNSITIWCGDNAHDQVGMRFAVYLFRERKQPLRIVNVSEIYKEMPMSMDNDEKVAPYAQSFIPREAYLEIVKKSNEIMFVESGLRRRYEMEWIEMSEQEHVLRLWRDGAVKAWKEDELDGMILETVAKLQKEKADEVGFVKMGAVMFILLKELDQLIGLDFFEYRIWTLISNGILAFRGLPGAMHQYSIRML